VVESTSLLTRQGLTSLEGSNPSVSAHKDFVRIHIRLVNLFSIRERYTSRMPPSERPKLELIQGGKVEVEETLVPIKYFSDRAQKLAEYIVQSSIHKEGVFKPTDLKERLDAIHTAYESVASQLHTLEEELKDIQARKKVIREGLAGERIRLLEREHDAYYTTDERRVQINQMIDEIERADGIRALRDAEESITERYTALAGEVARVHASLRALCAPVIGEEAKDRVQKLFEAAGVSNGVRGVSRTQQQS
jgi:hypothetical protein